MTSLRLILAAALAFATLSLTSCLDGREEIWVNADGSGRADFTYDIPSAATRFHGGSQGVSDLLDSLLADFPDSTHEIEQHGNRLKIRVRLSFQSPAEISNLTSSVEDQKTPKAFEHLAGKFDVHRELRTIDFTRTVSPGKALPTAFIPSSEFDGRRLVYILHLPVVPEISTATRIENGGLTQIWDRSLAETLREPLVIHFRAKIPIPGWIYATASAVVLTVIACLWRRSWRRIASARP